MKGLTAVQFVDPPILFEPLVPNVSTAARSRTLFHTTVDFSDDFELELTWHVRVRGREVVDDLARRNDLKDSDRVVIPILERSFVGRDAIEVRVQVGSTLHELDIFDPELVQELATVHGQRELSRYLCIDVAVADLQLAPLTVEVTEYRRMYDADSTDPSGAVPVFHIAGSAGFRPTAAVTMHFGIVAISVPAISVRVPPEISCENVSLYSKFNLLPKEFAETYQAAVAVGAYPIAFRNLRSYAAELNSDLGKLLGGDDQISVADDDDRYRIQSVNQALMEWLSNYSKLKLVDVTEEVASAAFSQLQSVLKSDLDHFTILVPRSFTGSLNMGSGLKHFSFQAMTVAYTDETVSGQRAQLLSLCFLGIIQICLAVRLGWVDYERVDWVQQMTKLAVQNRDSIVTLLLIFPAALYATVLRVSPKSLMRRKARLRLRYLETTVFALPVFVAVVAVGPPWPRLLIASLGGSGAIAILVAYLVSRYTSRQALQDARREHLVALAQAGGPIQNEVDRMVEEDAN